MTSYAAAFLGAALVIVTGFEAYPNQWWRHAPAHAFEPMHNRSLVIVVPPVDPWIPWIDEQGVQTQLVHAPLPQGYNPRSPLRRDLAAEILVLRTGEIEDAILEGSSGQGQLDQEIVAFMRHNWRVVLPPEQARWFRVQISQPDFQRPHPNPSGRTNLLPR